MGDSSRKYTSLKIHLRVRGEREIAMERERYEAGRRYNQRRMGGEENKGLASEFALLD